MRIDIYDGLGFLFDDPNIVELGKGWYYRKFPNETIFSNVRHDPIFTPIGLAVGASASTAAATGAAVTAIGVTAGVGAYTAIQQHKAGQEAEKLAEQRAAIEQENALAAKKEADEQARLEELQGKRLLATQQSIFSASGVRSNIGAPLLIKAETMRDIATEKSYILERGANIARNYRLSAAYERAYGRSKKRESEWDMVGTLLWTGLSVGTMGYKAGMFKGGGTGTGGPYVSSNSGVNSLMGWSPEP